MLTGFILALSIAQYPQYLGANQALRMIRAAPEIDARARSPRQEGPAERYWSAAEAYLNKAGRLSPKESAKEWLSLADSPEIDIADLDFEHLSVDQSGIGELIRVLPSPNLWPVIASQIRTGPSLPRRRAILAMLEFMSGKQAEALTDVQRLKGLTPSQEHLRASLKLDLALRSRDGNRIQQAYGELARVTSAEKSSGGDRSMELPDLVQIVGPARAKSILQSLLTHFDGEISAGENGEMPKLAREVALAQIGRIKHPQWTLCLSATGGPLFAVIHKRFPDVKRGRSQNIDWGDDSYAAAATRYLYYLVAQGRSPEALAFVNAQKESYWLGIRPPDDEIELLRARGKAGEFATFLEALVRRGTEENALDLYDDYCDAAGLTQRKTKFVASLPTRLRGTDANEWSTDVDRLVAERKILQAGEALLAQVKTKHLGQSNGMSYPNEASELLDAGIYLHRNDWIEIALSTGETLTRSETMDSLNEGWVCRELVREGRGAEAEQILCDSIRAQRSQNASSSSPLGSGELKEIARLYSRLGRPQDVVELLDEADGWEQPDLAYVGSNDNGEASFPLLAARALADIGRRREAEQLALFLIGADPESDEAYELLLRIDPSGARSILDRLHRSEPVNPRPVLWQAELQRRLGHLPQADALIHRAIALDPQDTRTIFEAHTRLQAWSILAKIERAEGKRAAAATHERKFTSKHRFGYNGEQDGSHLDLDPEDAGAADNPDDFEVQFDLADKLVKAGNRKTAEALVRKVSRQLPSEIGLASNVSWPDDPALTELCEPTLQRVSQTGPARSAALACLGSLDQHLNHLDEALQEDLEAVKLDADCLFGWENLDSLLELEPLPINLQDRVALNLHRLNGSRSATSKAQVLGFTRLWSTAHKAWADSPHVDLPVFPLRCGLPPDGPNYINAVWWRNHRRPTTGGSALADDPAVVDFLHLIGSLGAKGTTP